MAGDGAEVLVGAFQQHRNPERRRRPGLICLVPRPVHEFASGWLRFEQSLKSCGRAPLFVILNTITPCLTVPGATMKWNSAGLPAVTVTFATLIAPGPRHGRYCNERCDRQKGGNEDWSPGHLLSFRRGHRPASRVDRADFDLTTAQAVPTRTELRAIYRQGPDPSSVTGLVGRPTCQSWLSGVASGASLGASSGSFATSATIIAAPSAETACLAIRS